MHKEDKRSGSGSAINLDIELFTIEGLPLAVHRYKGDMPDPRGGIRWIFPDKAVYWKV